MILKKLLNSQTSRLIEEFIKGNKEIFDIAIYGSAIRNKINIHDIDFAIIFLQPVNPEKKLELSQELKDKLRKIIDYEIDVKGIDINDLLDSSFLARKAIIAEGFLVLRKKFLHEILGFQNYSIFSYSLKNLSASKKVMFQYALRGRRGEKGIIETTNSTLLGKGVLKIPLAYTEEFKEFFEKNKISHKISNGLYY